MKKFFTLISLLLAVSVTSHAQTYALVDFSDGQIPPAGWTIDNLASQWSINNGNVAGGTAPEGMFTYFEGIHTSRFISTVIDLTGLTSVTFSFAHFVDHYSGGGYSVGVATRSGGGSWNTVWEISPTGNVGPQVISNEITNSDVGSSTFQICIYITGNTWNIDFWHVDDLWLFNPLNLDGGITQITTPEFIGEPVEVTGILRNFGNNQIISAEIAWQVEEGDITTTQFSGLSVNFGQTYQFTCDGILDLPIGSHELKVWVMNVNGIPDEDPTNDMAQKIIKKVSHVTGHRPCFEQFTSSTCAPCASFNTSFVPWAVNNAEQLTLVKYQMSWPPPGDPYYTAEGGVRRNYYGVTAVPTTFVDGIHTAAFPFNASNINSLFNNSKAEPGLIKVKVSHTMAGTLMFIQATLLPFADFQDVIVHLIVFENVTTGNVGTNGETQFHHVMMKMVPDAYGTTINLTDRVPLTINEMVNLAGTNVEEWDDLGLAIFVQDGSKYIWQSDYSVEDGEFAADADLMQIYVNDEPIDEFDPSVMEYTVMLPFGTTELPVITAATSDPDALAIVIPAYDLPGTATIDVFAENLTTNQTYTLNFDISTGSHSIGFEAVNVYPNPATDLIYLTGAKNAKGFLHSITGSVVATFDNLDSGRIDLSGIDSGVYFLTITIENKTTITKKVVVRK